MAERGWVTIGALVGLFFAGRGPLIAWEIRLRDEITTSAAIVRLGDLAEFDGCDAATQADLVRVVIAPGPTAAHSRVLTVSQIRQILEQRGLDLGKCQFSGASRVVVTHGHETDSNRSAADTASTAKSPRRSGPGAAAAFERHLQDLVARQLEQLAGDGQPWSVEVRLSSSAVADGWQPSQEWTVEPPLREAREGTHQLVACLSPSATSARVPFEASARKMDAVVVALRTVERGELLRPQDVALQYVEEASETESVLRRLEDAVGRQARQRIAADQPVGTSAVQQPLLVRRRDQVEVWVRCGGIRAHRRAVALNDGARGDMITVDTNDGSKTQFLARVVDIRQVEVLPTSTTTEPLRE